MSPVCFVKLERELAYIGHVCEEGLSSGSMSLPVLVEYHDNDCRFEPSPGERVLDLVLIGWFYLLGLLCCCGWKEMIIQVSIACFGFSRKTNLNAVRAFGCLVEEEVVELL